MGITKSTIGNLIAEATEMLDQSGVPDAQRQASSLMAHALGADRTFVISHRDDEVNPDIVANFHAFVVRRAAGEPLQYITGYQEFFKLRFEVTPDVLIPRPETELLIETALALFGDRQGLRICDVGTGSGCIVISLLHELPTATAVAIDLSAAALVVAARNAETHHVAERIEFVVSDCFEAVDEQIEFDAIVSNPPYVREDAFAGLQREVRHEPRIALTPGGDGLGVICRLIRDSPKRLKEKGYLMLEMGFDQRDAVIELIDPHTWRLVEIQNDLQGIPRTVILQKIGPR